MGWFQSIFGGGSAGDTVKGIGEGISTVATGIRSAITGEISPEKKAELEKIALDAETQAQKLQLEINRAEAGHESTFVAGWRPFLGWTFGLGMANNYLLRPWAVFIAGLFDKNLNFPVVDLTLMLPLVTGMLGLAGMRTYEKSKGIATNH